MMEARDPSSHSLELQMQAFYEHLRGGYPPHQPSPLQQQQSSPHEQQQQQQHHLHHLHYQQLQQQHHQQQQHQHLQQQQHLNPPIIHSPAPLRQINLNPNLNNPNPVPNPNPNPNPNSTYPSETPAHTMPHHLQAASPSPPSGIGASMNASSAMAPRSAPMFKKKRGRPRKYGNDGNDSAALVIPLNSAPPVKKKSSSKKTQMSTSYGTTGEGFTPHVLTVGAGEDITAKIMTFSQHGPWAVCILSANGVISSASLWHSSISSGSVTYEGRFEILSLSGLFLLTEEGATRTRNGGISVSLAGQDGSIIGGRVAGLLIAATPIQVVVGTFFPESHKSQARSGNSSHMPPSIGARQTCSPMESTYTASGSAQGHIPGPPTGSEKEHHASHVMPLQSGDWGTSDFDADTRSHSE